MHRACAPSVAKRFAFQEQNVAGLGLLDRSRRSKYGVIGLVDINVDSSKVGTHDVLVSNPLRTGPRVGTKQPYGHVVDVKLATPIVSHDRELPVHVTAADKCTVFASDPCDVLREKSPRDGIRDRFKKFVDVGSLHIELGLGLEPLPTRDLLEGRGDGCLQSPADHEDVDLGLEQLAEGPRAASGLRLCEGVNTMHPLFLTQRMSKCNPFAFRCSRA